MKCLRCCIFFFLINISSISTRGQGDFKLDVLPEKRLPALWKQCTDAFISDKDSVYVRHYFDRVIHMADSAGDIQLKKYGEYFGRCGAILFAESYESHFVPGDYQSVVNIFIETQNWAVNRGYADIAASCEHYIGQVYYRANRYGMAFEHLLKADDAFKKIGYGHIPNAPEYLYNLGLHFYQFEEYDKSLKILLEASQFQFFIPRVELNTLNAIGLIYSHSNRLEKAVTFLRSTIQKAVQYEDTAWIGISTGNLGNVFLAENKNDSALFYHRKNFRLNTGYLLRAPEDAAKSALSMATIFLRQHLSDSARYYLDAGNALANKYIRDSTEALEFRRRSFKVEIGYHKEKNDFKRALMLMDSMSLVEQQLRSMLDIKILTRAVEKTEATSYNDRLDLLKSQKDLDRLRYYFFLAGLLLIITIVGVLFREKWLKRKRQMQLSEKDNYILQVEKLRAEDGLQHAQDLLKAYVDTIREKTIVIGHLESEVSILKQIASDVPELDKITSNREKLVASTILTDAEWLQFRGIFEQVYPGFSYRLRENYPELSPAEARLLYLTKLNLSSREMAAMLGISVQTIHKLRYRLRKKLSLEEDSDFNLLLKKIT